jgi:hypothetical protein
MRLTDWILVEVALLLIGLAKISLKKFGLPAVANRFASLAAASEVCGLIAGNAKYRHLKN